MHIYSAGVIHKKGEAGYDKSGQMWTCKRGTSARVDVCKLYRYLYWPL